jgi:hypothetical protein
VSFGGRKPAVVGCKYDDRPFGQPVSLDRCEDTTHGTVHLFDHGRVDGMVLRQKVPAFPVARPGPNPCALGENPPSPRCHLPAKKVEYPQARGDGDLLERDVILVGSGGQLALRVLTRGDVIGDTGTGRVLACHQTRARR